MYVGKKFLKKAAKVTLYGCYILAGGIMVLTGFSMAKAATEEAYKEITGEELK